jgi:hypothetical protein
MIFTIKPLWALWAGDFGTSAVTDGPLSYFENLTLQFRSEEAAAVTTNRGASLEYPSFVRSGAHKRSAIGNRKSSR